MNTPKSLDVPTDRQGQRLDNFLLSQLKVPKSLIYRLLRKGAIRVDGKRAKPAHRLLGGESIRLPQLVQTEREPGTAPPAVLQIAASIGLYEDDHYLIVNKPSGWAAHSGSGLDWGLIEAVRQSRADPTLELAHRLDRATSGVSILCKTRVGLGCFHDALQNKAVHKRYVALLSGAETRSQWEVVAPLLKGSGKGNQPQVVVSDQGQASTSHFRVIEHFPQATLVEVVIETGRMHQIRVHAQHSSSSLAGDDRYGAREDLKRFRDLGLRRLFLHCAEMSFPGPETSVRVTAPLPEALDEVLAALRR